MAPKANEEEDWVPQWPNKKVEQFCSHLSKEVPDIYFVRTGVRGDRFCDK